MSSSALASTIERPRLTGRVPYWPASLNELFRQASRITIFNLEADDAAVLT